MITIVKGFAAAAALLAAGSAIAAEPAARVPADKAQVLVCDRPTPAGHVKHRQHGRMDFVSAQQLLADPAPSAKPRCITRAELERYATLYAQRTRELASR